jgi:histidine triad (HIT) family protein
VSGCAFCEIASGKVEARVVHQTSRALAFLDHRPLFRGHVLLIPREHHQTLVDLPEGLTGELFLDVRLLSRAVEEAMDAEGTFVAINNRVSQSVPHLHIHIVPRRKKDGLRGFFWPRSRYESEEAMAAVQQAIRGKVAELSAGRSSD